jgi:hypothetical protein
LKKFVLKISPLATIAILQNNSFLVSVAGKRLTLHDKSAILREIFTLMKD